MRSLEIGNMKILEYPKGATDPKFSIDKNGSLWIEGYLSSPFPFIPPIKSMKRFDGFEGYTVIGRYGYANTVVGGEPPLDKILYENDFDFDSCVILIKTETIPLP